MNYHTDIVNFRGRLLEMGACLKTLLFGGALIRSFAGKFVANKFKLMSSEGQASYFQKLSPQLTKEVMACAYS